MASSHRAMSLRVVIRKATVTKKVIENIKDAISLHVEDRVASGEDIPQPRAVSLTMMELAV